MNEIIGLLEQVLAIEMLEYHDKNHLSGNNCTRYENKMELLKMVIDKLEK
jgi:hypothetical protein